MSGSDKASQRLCLGWRFLLYSHLNGVKVDRGQLKQWCGELPMETRWLRPNASVFFFFLMLRIWPFMHFSVDITEAPHFFPLFQLNLEAHWATIQQTAHEHSLKTWSGIIISKNICPADTVVQQEELAGCQLQPWNPTVVIKKLIKWVTFSPEKKAHGEPVVSTIASSSTGLSERTWRSFRPGLGASRYKKLLLPSVLAGCLWRSPTKDKLRGTPDV